MNLNSFRSNSIASVFLLFIKTHLNNLKLSKSNYGLRLQQVITGVSYKYGSPSWADRGGPTIYLALCRSLGGTTSLTTRYLYNSISQQYKVIFTLFYLENILKKYEFEKKKQFKIFFSFLRNKTNYHTGFKNFLFFFAYLDPNFSITIFWKKII